MKKMFSTVLIIFALLCTACNSGIDPDDLDFDRAFSFTANLEYNGRESVAQFARSAPGQWSGTLVEPYSLQGIEIAYSPLEMSVSYAGFAVNHGEDSPPDINITAFVMLAVLESAFLSEDVSISSGKDWVEIAGSHDGGVYVLRLDKNGLPVSLSIPNQQLKVTFSEVAAMNF